MADDLGPTGRLDPARCPLDDIDSMDKARLAGDPATFRYNPNPLLRGVLALNIAFDPGASRRRADPPPLRG